MCCYSPSPITGRFFTFVLTMLLAFLTHGTETWAHSVEPEATESTELRTLFIVGDSTAQQGHAGAIGWGRPFASLFDANQINVVNAAIGGRSSRTFVTEGRWERVRSRLQPGDYVLIQFGHNDGGPINHPLIPRGSLRGLGEETEEIDNERTKEHEVIHTFGWYTRKMVREAREQGAMPILLSLTVRNIWKEGKVERGSGYYSKWTREIADNQNVAFIDLTNLIADAYEELGKEAVKPFFPKDHVHTGEAGAAFNARHVVSGLAALHESGITSALSPEGRVIDVARHDAVRLGRHVKSNENPKEAKKHWLNLPTPADETLPHIFLIGDSTVRNGRGDGSNGQWGWGDPLSAYTDPSKVNLVNRAVGGLGARSFISSGHWDSVLDLLKPGDIVLMQFGHNDNGPRGAIRGVGEESREHEKDDGEMETVRTFGWYLRKYVAETRAKGATPVICTLIPRNLWRDGKILRAANGHASWARAVAQEKKVPLIDLHEKIAVQYEKLGKESVPPLFGDEYVHTSREGAELNAKTVHSSMQELPGNLFGPFLRVEPATTW